MKARHLSLGAVGVACALVLAACATPTPAPQFDTATDAQKYVDLLRGENDLAHGSLEVPSQSTLPAFAAVSAALRYAGEPGPAASPEVLGELTRRSGEDAAWSAYYLCEATGGDIPTVEGIMPSLGFETLDMKVPDIEVPNIEVPNIDSINAAADVIIGESARACLGRPTLLEESDWRGLARYSEGNALVAVQLAALARRLGHPAPPNPLSPADVSAIEHVVETDGCTEWVLANSVAARALVAVPAAVETCASLDDVAITDPSVLLYLIAARVPASQLTSLLEANGDTVDRALAVEGTVATAATPPVGNGTIAASRDAVLYLRLSASPSAPDWLAEGVLAAIGQESAVGQEPAAGHALSESDTIDALYLCAALELDCPSSFVTRASYVTLGVIEAALTHPTAGTARAVEAALEARLDVPTVCTRERVIAWLDDQPQLLAAFAAAEKECVQTVELNDSRLAPLVKRAINELRPEDALAYCLLRLLANDARPADSTFAASAHESFAALWARLDAENGDGYLDSARPLRIELAQAKEDQWLD